MKKVEEYHRHAAECRDLARIASPSHRQQLEQMADTWDQLAEARRHQLEKSEQVRPAPVIEFEIPPNENPLKH